MSERQTKRSVKLSQDPKWMPLAEAMAILEEIHRDLLWLGCWELKYTDVRIDMRTMQALIATGNGFMDAPKYVVGLE